MVREYEEQTLAEDQDQLDQVDEEGEEVEVDMDEDVDDEEEQEKKETPSEEIVVSENVISAEAAAASTLALYKDVINDFLGVINFPKFNQEHGQQLSKLEDDERRPDFWDSLREAEVEEEEEEEEKEERFQSEEVSQYSYGSFLSEVYRVTLERMKQRVKI